MATTNMGLTLPVVSVTLGPQWATELNAALTLVDAHDHTSGKGKTIPTAGLNINADLSFANNSATLLKSVQLNDNVSTLAIQRSIYASGGDLWYTNSSGNTVQITNGGAVNAGAGSITGLSSPASAAYNSGTATFSWSSAVNSLASMRMGAVVLHASANPTLNSLSIQAPLALVAPYNITLPDAVPTGAGGFLMMRATGAQGYAYPDNSTIEENPSGTIKVKTITNSNIADNSIHGGKLTSFSVYSDRLSIPTYYRIQPSSLLNVNAVTEYLLLTETQTLPQGFLTVTIQPSAEVPLLSATNGFRVDAINTVTTDNIQHFVKFTFPDLSIRYYPLRKFIEPNVRNTLGPFSVTIPAPAGLYTISYGFKCYNSNTLFIVENVEMVTRCV